MPPSLSWIWPLTVRLPSWVVGQLAVLVPLKLPKPETAVEGIGEAGGGVGAGRVERAGQRQADGQPSLTAAGALKVALGATLSTYVEGVGAIEVVPSSSTRSTVMVRLAGPSA